MRRAWLLILVTACAKADLPGDTVASDGAVSLASPRLAPATHEPLGAVEAALFAPDFIMEHQAAIGLQPAQRDAITKEVDETQSERLPLQWKLDAEKESLVKILEADEVDEQQAQKAAVRVMEAESSIKAGHLAMLVRIKNLLTPEQQKQLKALRASTRG